MTGLATTPRSRRAVITGALGGVAALAVQAAARPLEVDAAGNLILGSTTNASNAPTLVTTTVTTTGIEVTNNATSGTALIGRSIAPSGVGVLGEANVGVGIFGSVLEGESTAVVGDASSLTGETYGCVGQVSSPDGIGLMGWNVASGTAVAGYAGTTDATVAVRPNVGVFGIATEGGTEARGVVGQVTHGQGVRGEATDGIGGVFRSETGRALVASVALPSQVALETNGRVVLRNRSGKSTVSGGRASKTIQVAGVTSSNFAIATLAADRPGTYVRAVVCGPGSIKILLNRAVTRNTSVSWLVLG